MTSDSRHSTDESPVHSLGTVAAAWGIAGFVFLLLRGIMRVLPEALALPVEDFGIIHWAATTISIIAFGVGEGYLAIQRHYVPRFLKRADNLRRHPHLFSALLAPLYCMGLIGWDLRTTLRGWGMVTGIVLMILGMRFVPAPWREIILIGVVFALMWASLFFAVAGVRFLLRPR